MPTLKDISLRLKSIKNIQKITKSMKMVSAAKYARAERELKPARPYGLGAQAFYERAAVPFDEKKPKQLFVAISSDRGLCGAIHSSVAKRIKADVAGGAQAADAAQQDFRIVAVGDKARSLLQRQYSSKLLFHAQEVGRKAPVFGDAAIIAEKIIDSGYQFDQGRLYYNYFKSVVSYQTKTQPIFSFDTLSQSEKINIYDDVDEETLRSYQEFSLASLIFYALKESTTSEQSARMTAMDNASKNAGEIIGKLTLKFNRTRQAVITKELIEIISGAAAL